MNFSPAELQFLLLEERLIHVYLGIRTTFQVLLAIPTNNHETISSEITFFLGHALTVLNIVKKKIKIK